MDDRIRAQIDIERDARSHGRLLEFDPHWADMVGPLADRVAAHPKPVTEHEGGVVEGDWDRRIPDAHNRSSHPLQTVLERVVWYCVAVGLGLFAGVVLTRIIL